jgi:hypothetical protein
MNKQLVIIGMDDFDHLSEVFEREYSVVAHCEPDGVYKLIYEGVLYYAAYTRGHMSLEEISDALFDKFEYDTRQFISRTRSYEIESALTNQIWSPEFASFLYQSLDLLYQTLRQRGVPATEILPNSLKHTLFQSYNQVVYYALS